MLDEEQPPKQYGFVWQQVQEFTREDSDFTGLVEAHLPSTGLPAHLFNKASEAPTPMFLLTITKTTSHPARVFVGVHYG